MNLQTPSDMFYVYQLIFVLGMLLGMSVVLIAYNIPTINKDRRHR